MASVFKRKKSRKWTIAYIDHAGKRREAAGTYDKAATLEIARKLESNTQLRRRGVIDAEQERLTSELHRPLEDHVKDFQEYMESKGSGDKHIDVTVNYIREIIRENGFKTLADLDVVKVSSYINALRRDKKGLCSINARITAIKAFSKWLWKTDRLRNHVMKLLSKQNHRTDERHRRRVLTEDEIKRLLAAAENGESFISRKGLPRNSDKIEMTGPDRAMLYRFALETGFRASECGSLTPESFDLDDLESARVTVEAAYSKHRRKDVQPLRRSFAEMMKAYLESKQSGEKVFPMPPKPVKMLQVDLEAAGIDYRDSSDRYVDFHALRHTFITRLIQAGAAPAVAQRLARHSTITLTMDYYTHVLVTDERAALERLPSLSEDEADRKIA